MPTHYYLTTEVRRPEDLEYADVLLGAHPKAAAALDLLLGTQGWRRFAEQNPQKFRQQFKEDADRLLVTTGQASQKSVDLAQHDWEECRRNLRRNWRKCRSRRPRLRRPLLSPRVARNSRPKWRRCRTNWLNSM